MKNYLILILSILSLNNYAQSAAKTCSDSKIKGYNSFHNRNSRNLSDQSNYDVKFLKLELNVSDTTTFIQGKCTQVVKVLASNMTQFVFELHENLNVTNAKINNVNAAVQRIGNELILESDTLHVLNDLVSIEVSYNGTPPSSTAFNGETGVYNAKSPTWGVYATWTLSEPFFAHTWWPTKQVLTDKIDSTELIFVCNDNLKVGSNGLLVSEESLPNNKTRFTWKSNYPIDYYLVSFAVAKYQDYSFKILPTGETDSLLIQNFIYNVQNYLDYFEADILETGDMMFLLSDLYGQYPFIKEKYGHCIAPLSGGMEHQTMTTQGFFDSWLTMHELAHQWWGNSVTCATWNEVWINEGFASYSEYLYAQNISQSAADNDMNQRHLNIKAQPGGSVYVYDITNSDNIFDSRLIYDKGSAVVHMLRNIVNNDSLFFKTLRKVQSTYKGSTISTSQLQSFLTQETGVDLSQFMSSWIYGEGYPIYSGSYNILNDTTYVRINQKSSLTASTLTYPASLELLVTFFDGTDTLLRVSNSEAIEDYYFLINKEIDNVQVDPNKWILKEADQLTLNPNLYFEVVNSINELNDFQMVYNNPVNDYLEIKMETNQHFNLNILNIKGEIVYSKKNLKERVKIDSKNWSTGLYFINTEINNQIKTSKFLKL